MQIAVITGEASGDRVGGQLAREIKRLRPDAEIWGTGGDGLRDAGAEVVVDATRWGVIGIASGLALLPRILRAYGGLKRDLLRRRPDVIVSIDAGAFNLGFAGVEGLCPWARKHLPQTRILYYFPPGSWRRHLSGSPLGPLTDAVATPFPWSETQLRRFGVNAHFVGHPLLDLVHPTEDATAFAARFGIDRNLPIVGILPGSRRGEIEQVLPVQLDAAAQIHARIPGIQFVIAQAPTVDDAALLAQIEAERARRYKSARRHALPSKSAVDERRRPVPLPVPAEGGQGPLTPDYARQRDEWLRRAAELPPSASSDFPLVIVPNRTYDVIAISDALMATSGTATLEAAILGKPMVIGYKMADINRIEYQFAKKRLRGSFIGMPNILAQREICPELIQDALTPGALADDIIALLLEPDRRHTMQTDLQEAVSLLGMPGGAARTAEMVVGLAEGKPAEGGTSDASRPS